MRTLVLDYMQATERAAHAVLEGVALSLGLEKGWFLQHYTANPTVLFRIFHYPPQPAGLTQWGVGEHTDYGLLTLLLQDTVPGLQVRTPRGWMDAPPLPGTLVCNIGDMLDRLTGGVYRSTPHRVLNASGRERYSFPLFFDPDFSARVTPLPQHAYIGAEQVATDRADRWDGASVLAPFDGTYGDYLLDKEQIFARLTLSDDEYDLYRQIYDRAAPSAATPPDLVIYLQAAPDVLIERVRKRGVEMERKIGDDYLTLLSESYTRFFHDYAAAPVLVVNSEHLNFVDDTDDFQILLQRIEGMRGPREDFNKGD